MTRCQPPATRASPRPCPLRRRSRPRSRSSAPKPMRTAYGPPEPSFPNGSSHPLILGTQNAIIGSRSPDSCAARSPEFRTHQFEGYYNALLHRPKDPANLTAWVTSGLDMRAVRFAFETGPEFFANVCPRELITPLGRRCDEFSHAKRADFVQAGALGVRCGVSFSNLSHLFPHF